MPCSEPPTYAGAELIAVIAVISVTVVASVLRGRATRDISNGTIVIVANASALIHNAPARVLRPVRATSVEAPLTSSTQATPHTPVISQRVTSPSFVISWRDTLHAIAGDACSALPARAAAGCAPRGVGSALAAAMIRGLAVFNAVLVTLGR